MAVLVGLGRVAGAVEFRVGVAVTRRADRHEMQLFHVGVRGRVVRVRVLVRVRMGVGMLVRVRVREVAVAVLVRVLVPVLVRMLVGVRVAVRGVVRVIVGHGGGPLRAGARVSGPVRVGR